jgi:membrane protease YdiL (CAAX protease family)
MVHARNTDPDPAMAQARMRGVATPGSTLPTPPAPSPASMEGECATPRRGYLVFEYLVLFFGLPALFAFRVIDVPFFALLLSAAAITGFILWRDRSFDRTALWNAAGWREGIGGVLSLWLLGVVALSAIVLVFVPEVFLRFPRERPQLWALVMVAYPILSVYPQNIIYRAFVFHRYRGVFRGPEAMLWASALAFCFGHVIFHNWVALTLTLAGGLIFARTYQKHRSLALCATEHALYGQLIFTVGLGWYLVHRFAGS